MLIRTTMKVKIMTAITIIITITMATIVIARVIMEIIMILQTKQQQR